MKQKERGLIITSILFITLLLFIGLSLLANTIFHIKISGARNGKKKEINLLKLNLTEYLHNIREDIYNEDLNSFEFLEIDYFNNEKFPDINELKYIITNIFENKIISNDKYKSIKINNKVSVSTIDKKLSLTSNMKIDILSGNIPVSAIPLYINKNPDISKELFLSKNNINMDTSSFLIKNDTNIKFEFNDFICNSLDLNGKVLNWKEIREKAGVEINDTPLENGIYSFINTGSDDILNAIFIQGDVQRIVFSIEDDIQKLLLTHQDKDYILEYKPDKYSLKWSNDLEESILFKQKIIINGNIFSLIRSGDFAFLNEANICLYSSGIVNIDSSLNSDNSVGSNLKIITGFNEFFNKPDNSGNIIIKERSDNSIIKLSVSFIATNKLINNNDETTINGSIYTDEVENNGIMNVSTNFKNNTIDTFFTTEKFTFIKDFIVSFNGEVYNE